MTKNTNQRTTWRSLFFFPMNYQQNNTPEHVPWPVHVLQNTSERHRSFQVTGLMVYISYLHRTTESFNSLSYRRVFLQEKMRCLICTMPASFHGLENINVDPQSPEPFRFLSHCLRIHWSQKKRMTFRVSSSSVSSSDSSHYPFCSFCFSSCGFSAFFPSSSPLHQTKSAICCLSFSSLSSPHHSMMKQI